MPDPTFAWKKLREAWFFLGHLRSTESGPRTPENFDYYLSAFLNAARSAVYKTRFALGSWDAVDAWKATRNDDDRAFFDSMTELRHSEVHNEGAAISREQEAVPMRLSFDARDSARFAAMIASGMLGSTEVYIDHHYVDLEDKRLEAFPACNRFVALLEDLLRYVDGLTAKDQAT